VFDPGRGAEEVPRWPCPGVRVGGPGDAESEGVYITQGGLCKPRSVFLAPKTAERTGRMGKYRGGRVLRPKNLRNDARRWGNACAPAALMVWGRPLGSHRTSFGGDGSRAA